MKQGARPEDESQLLDICADASSLPVVMTAEELARLLRVDRKTVYDALKRGEIPGVRRIGTTYRIYRDAVVAWFTSQDRVSRPKR